MNKRKLGKRIWKRKAMTNGWGPTGGVKSITAPKENTEFSPGLMAMAMAGIFSRLRSKTKGATMR